MTTQKPQVIIFAAGYGTRLLPLTKTTPKPLLHINGEAVIVKLIKQVNREPVERDSLYNTLQNYT